MSKIPSILFPGMRNSSSVVGFSRNEIKSLCDLNPVISCVKSMGNYMVQRNKSHQMSKQYTAMKSAVDAEYTALEQQAYIHFQELTRQLEDEFKLKSELLKKQIEVAEREADVAYMENKVEFQQYIKKSSSYRKIFKLFNESAEKIYEVIKCADDNDMKQNKYYWKLLEQYRKLTRKISKYNELI